MNYLKKELYELVRSDDRVFDFIQDDSLDGLWYRDMENPDNEWMNPRFWKTLGYNPEEMPHKAAAWQKVVHPDDLQLTINNLNRLFENPDQPYDQVVRYIHKNGPTVWMRCTGMTIRNKAGKPTRLLVAHTNITKQKETEEKHNILFNSIDEGFCIIEMIFDEQKKPVDYRFMLINSSFEKQTGLRDAVGKRMREFAPDHEAHWFDIYGNVALTGEPIRFENRAEQLQRWYDVYAFRFGKPENLQVAILFNDITKRKQAEETIRVLHKELESFSYSVSHDLRAPLRILDGYAKMLDEDFSNDLPAEAKRYIDAICMNSRRMGILIDDLLDFSRLGRKEIEKNHVDTANMVKRVAEDIRNLYAAGKTIIDIGDLLPAYGDTTLLKQVWVNLISNAYKYSQKNPSPSIEIGSSRGNNEIIYFVKDNGVGFDMKYYHKLFGVFQRLHSPKEFEGTGVGLAIVERIVTRHGGRVWAEAKTNEGACFYFTIPVIES